MKQQTNKFKVNATMYPANNRVYLELQIPYSVRRRLFRTSPLTHTNYTTQTIHKLKDHNSRGKRGMLLTALLPCRDIPEARKAYANVQQGDKPIPFGAFIGWMVRKKYITLGPVAA